MNESERELLSAYIDDRLTTDETTALERRLASDSALRLELDTLRETQALLRGLPTLRAPRSLALTSAMIGARPRPLYLSTWVSFASAAAAVVLMGLGLLTSVNLNLSNQFVNQAPQAGVAAVPTEGVSLTSSQTTIAIVPISSATLAALPTLTREDDGQAQDIANAALQLTGTPAAEARTAMTTTSPDVALMAAPAAADSAAGDSAAGAAASGMAESSPPTTTEALDASGETESAAEMQFAATMPAQTTPAPRMTAPPSATAITQLSPTSPPTAQIVQLPTLTSDALPQEAARQDRQADVTPSLILIVAGVMLLLFALVTTLLRLRSR